MFAFAVSAPPPPPPAVETTTNTNTQHAAEAFFPLPVFQPQHESTTPEMMAAAAAAAVTSSPPPEMSTASPNEHEFPDVLASFAGLSSPEVHESGVRFETATITSGITMHHHRTRHRTCCSNQRLATYIDYSIFFAHTYRCTADSSGNINYSMCLLPQACLWTR